MILYPPHESAIDPILFLAGPIQGADDWQAEAAQRLHDYNDSPDFVIANPRRPEKLNDVNHFEQVDWEHEYLGRAARYGVVLFYLAPEAQHFCERAYAQTTRFELAETVARYPDAKIVVGIHRAFPGASYIRYTISKKYRHNVHVRDTLKGAVAQALELRFPTRY